MDVICNNCQSRLKIPNNKIPKDKTAVIKCPRCKSKISIRPGITDEDLNQKPIDEKTEYDDAGQDLYDSYDRPFDFIEEELNTALVCERDPKFLKKITDVLNLMEYHITKAEKAGDALKKMRFHNYDLVIINERFDTTNPDSNGVLLYLERLGMSVRRNIFVSMISSRFRTMDNMMAFNKSVNLIINKEHINEIDKILPRAITDNEFFFRKYNETLKAFGRI